MPNVIMMEVHGFGLLSYHKIYRGEEERHLNPCSRRNNPIFCNWKGTIKMGFKSEVTLLTCCREHLHQIFNKVVEKIILLLADQVEEIKRTTGASPKVCIRPVSGR